MKEIKRAIISVSDKTNLLEFARELKNKGVEIYSTGGTLRALKEADIEAISIGSYTGFPEILDGRVKTLHPKVHGGILAKRDNESHVESLTEHAILTFDLVCINLYPFEEVIRKEDFSFEEAIENIDIGGPSMIRAAAKNYKDVAVVVDSSQYDEIIKRLNENSGALAEEYRFQLSVEAFARTSAYDSVISQYLYGLQGDKFPDKFSLAMKKHQPLRYGENPHQGGAFFVPVMTNKMPWMQLHGKELSYNNFLDLDSAIAVAKDFTGPVCAIFKHTNPCGISFGKSQLENLKRAIQTDPVSFFGGIVSFNDKVTLDTAELLNQHFFEIIVAPDYDDDALDVLKKKKNLRLIRIPNLKEINLPNIEIKNSCFGFLLQESDQKVVNEEEIKIVTQKKPDKEQLEELLFAFQTVKYIKSNAVVFSKDKHTLAIGAGQMSRLDSINIAVKKAKDAGLSLEGSCLASEAFFPFRDAVDMAIEAGANAVIQPGGSINDEESIKAADEAGIIMAFTGIRHFRHG
ncbi:MAG: bifunctional phosphoribosylaminoimidazolecarboxamide formyltransferase/IMP cyclohydrolase [Spirochaetia bacterium]|nr:bifunctional phosphoribosylaminoimidazolecarboxamide formyltransferase/IMP cyclohydrolase [Spirochaetia bacterium]